MVIFWNFTKRKCLVSHEIPPFLFLFPWIFLCFLLYSHNHGNQALDSYLWCIISIKTYCCWGYFFFQAQGFAVHVRESQVPGISKFHHNYSKMQISRHLCNFLKLCLTLYKQPLEEGGRNEWHNPCALCSSVFGLFSFHGFLNLENSRKPPKIIKKPGSIKTWEPMFLLWKPAARVSHHYSHLHNTLHNGFVKTYLVMFQQDPRCHTKPVFGCLEHAKATAGKICHHLWMPPLIVRGQDAILHTFWVVGCYSSRTHTSVWAWARVGQEGTFWVVWQKSCYPTQPNKFLKILLCKALCKRL